MLKKVYWYIYVKYIMRPCCPVSYLFTSAEVLKRKHLKGYAIHFEYLVHIERGESPKTNLIAAWGKS